MENTEIMEEVIDGLKDVAETVNDNVETVENKVTDEATEEVTETTEEVEEAAAEAPEEVAEDVADETVGEVEKSKDEFTVVLKEVASLKKMVEDVIKQINKSDTKIKEVRAEIAELFFDGTATKPEDTEIDFTNLF